MFSDDVPPTSTSASVPSKACGTVSLRSSRTASIVAGTDGSPATGTLQHRDVAAGCPPDLAVSEPRVRGERRAQLLERARDVLA